MNDFLKITYHLGGNKRNAYIKILPPTYLVLKNEIEMRLFDDLQQQRCEIRIYWIDEVKDEIEMVNQSDYEIFLVKNIEWRHLHVAPIGIDVKEPTADVAADPDTSIDSESDQTKIPPAAGSYDFAVHNKVECDSCLMSPIIGFRYKCIECPNYDLCENCESKHIHSEHMMVRMPTNNCPNVVESYVTGRGSGRRHGKRSKTSCPFVKSGISVVIDGDTEQATSSTGGNENTQQSSPTNGKERHHGRKHHRRQHRNNIFSHLYEMMHDLAEGGGAAAAAHAMGESHSFTSNNGGSQTPNSAKFTFNTKGFENEGNPIAAAAAAAAAHMASQCAQDAATKAAEIAAKVANETASNVAKNFAENMAASASSAATENAEEKNETTEEEVDAATTSSNGGPQQADTDPIIPSPSLEGLAQFLDPQYMRTGIQILNNFSDMFARMLDPLDDGESERNQTDSYSQKDANASKKTSISSNINSLGSEKKSDKENSLDGNLNPNQEKTEEKTLSGRIEITDLGSESENESISESFVKLNAPRNCEDISTSSTSVDITPPKSLEKSNVLDFAQLSADLKAHIAQEAEKGSQKSNDNPKETKEKSATPQTSTSPTPTKKSEQVEERRAVPVYHSDQRINNSVLAMMSMGFSNEGAWLTELLESVNGNIPEALDVMTAAQSHGDR